MFVKGLLPFKYKRFQLLGHPRDVRCVHTHLLNGHEQIEFCAECFVENLLHIFAAVSEEGKTAKANS